MKVIKKFIRKIVTKYRRMADDTLQVFAQKVVDLTTVSAALANPTPTMKAVQDAIDDYAAKLSAAQNRDTVLVGLKNTAKGVLIGLLDELANFVTLVANNDLDILLSSGFEISKLPQSVIIDTPSIVFINGDNPGELVSIAKEATNAKSIEHEITADPLTEESVWEKITTTVKSYTHKGLQKGKNYWGRVTSVSGNNQRKQSVPVSRVSQ